ncbi:transporter [Gluconacetobacter tumulicola]|uniref:transporter n=1 Tax=Gluconacetobacter tumulicola TaxID=1017177 RepID=UPI001FE63DF6|nr:transporter [Gluconacetobacter tumulicola]
MHALRARRGKCGLLWLAVSLAGTYEFPSARASDITLDVIGPHEYELPIDFNKPWDILVQYVNGNAAGSVYNTMGQRQARGGSHTWQGMSKWVHFWKFRGIPNVGFGWELIQVENYVLADGTNYGGLGPTISGPVVWFKPNRKSTFGMQAFMQTPSGTRDALSTNYWSVNLNLVFDYEWKNFSFDGDVGTVVGATLHETGRHSYTPGTTFYTNLRFSWKASKVAEPFFALDWQNAGGLYDHTAGNWVSDSSSREIALGVGMMFPLTRSLTFTTRYSHSVDGRNVPETNAWFGKIIYVF